MKYIKMAPELSIDVFGFAFFKLVEQANNIIITSHKSCDDDSIASVLSVLEILTNKYPEKNIRIIYTGEKVDRYKIFKGFNKIEWVEDVADHLKQVDLLIMLDGSQFSRFTFKPKELKKVKSTICIDHHASPIDKFTLSFVAPIYPANAELIYRALCSDIKVSKELAEIFLLGVLGDTGNFSYLKSHQTGTLTVAKELLDISEVELQEFQSQYRTISLTVFEIIKELIKNTQYSNAKGWPDFQYSYLDRSFVVKGKYTDNQISEGSHIYTSHYLRGIAGYQWGFVATPRSNGEVSVSLRSLPGSVNVRVLMELMKLGGGHDRAAGGTFKKDSQDVDSKESVEKILAWLDKNKTIIG